jgi:hypothetical protein
VYSEQVVTTTSRVPDTGHVAVAITLTGSPSETIWTDAQQESTREQANEGGAPPVTITRRGVIALVGRSYFYRYAMPAAQWRSDKRHLQAFRHGGFSGEGEYYLAQATDPVARVNLSGRAALRFDIADHDPLVRRHTIWLAAGTHMVVQEKVRHSGGLVIEYRYSHMQRLAPYTLPANFFDPWHTRRSLWDEVTGWLHDHLR